MRDCSIQSKNIRNSSIQCNSILSRQLLALEQTNNILKKLDDCRSNSFTIEKFQSQISQRTHKLASIQLDILRLEQNLQILEHEYQSNEDEKMKLVGDIESKQLQLECLGRKLVESYKFIVKGIDKVRLQMMELQDHQLLKPLEPIFSFRKAVLAFLRQNLLVKHSYLYGLQLQISLEKKTTQFKQFLISLVKNIGGQNQIILLQIVSRYAQLLKQAEEFIKKANSDRPSTNEQQEREQLVRSTSKLKIQLIELQAKLKELSLSSKLSKKISHSVQSIQKRKDDKREAQLRLSMLKEKVRCLQINRFKEEQLKQQLLEVNQAIDYLNSRKVALENRKTDINSSINLLPNKQLFSPSSSTSLPQLRKSKGKRQSNMVSSISIRSSSRKLVLNSSKNREKLSSPSVWK